MHHNDIEPSGPLVFAMQTLRPGKFELSATCSSGLSLVTIQDGEFDGTLGHQLYGFPCLCSISFPSPFGGQERSPCAYPELRTLAEGSPSAEESPGLLYLIPGRRPSALLPSFDRPASETRAPVPFPPAGPLATAFLALQTSAHPYVSLAI